MTGRPAIQSASRAGESASYFAPGQSGEMTGDEFTELIDAVLMFLPCLEAELQNELDQIEADREPTHDEICAALILSVQEGATIVCRDYSQLFRGCGCPC